RRRKRDVLKTAVCGRPRFPGWAGPDPLGQAGDGRSVIIVEERAMTAARGVAMVLDGSDNNLGGRRSLSALGIRFRHQRRAGRGSGADHRRADQECAATFIMLFHAEFLPFDSVRAQIARLDGATWTATDNRAIWAPRAIRALALSAQAPSRLQCRVPPLYWPGLEPTSALDCSLSGTDGKPAAPVKRSMRRG